MSKQIIPFATPDLSAFAKALRDQLTRLERLPSHVELLNMLARAGGHANFQALRADAAAQDRLTTEPATASADHARLEKVIRHFDSTGRMLRWPGKTNHQDLCLWVIWSRIPADQRFSEREINRFIIEGHTFGDHAILRRSLVDMKMLARTPDGKLYRRIEKKPDPDATALIEAMSHRIAP